MKKSIKIALGVGVVVVGYFLYKKNKGAESTESTESTANKNIINGIQVLKWEIEYMQLKKVIWV